MRALLALTAFAFFWVTPLAEAQEFTSSNFRISAPVIAVPGGYGASTNFQLYGALQQPAIGTSTITNFGDNSGFLYYPFVNAPVVTATAGDSQVTLTWTASTGALGWNVSGYNVGQSTSAGGPYAYTDVGNVLTSARTGLTNGTAYYFVVRPEDAFGESIATSTEASATPQGAGGGGEVGGGNGPPGPAPQPLFSRIIRFITGERAPTEACEKRSDFNCDNRVGLQDLSILFARPTVVSGKVLSYLFSDWTEPLPVPRPDPVLPRGMLEAQPPRAFTQVSSILTPQEPAEAEPRVVPPKRKTFLEVVVGIVRAVARAITQLFRR